MPRIQTLRVEASEASVNSRVRNSNGPPPAVRSAPVGGPVARRAAPRTSVMPGATCSLSPTRARSTASWRPITGSSSRRTLWPVRPAALNANVSQLARRGEIAEHVRRAVGGDRGHVDERRADGRARRHEHDLLAEPDCERRRLERRVVAQGGVVPAGTAGAHRHGTGAGQPPSREPAGEARGRRTGSAPRSARACGHPAPTTRDRAQPGPRCCRPRRAPAGARRRRTARRRRAGSSGGAVPCQAS